MHLAEKASKGACGHVKIGDGLNVVDGVLSAGGELVIEKFVTPGTFTRTVPQGVKKIYMSGSGGGGGGDANGNGGIGTGTGCTGGTGAQSGTVSNGVAVGVCSGGGGAIVDTEFIVNSLEVITKKVGAGGNGANAGVLKGGNGTNGFLLIKYIK